MLVHFLAEGQNQKKRYNFWIAPIEKGVEGALQDMNAGGVIVHKTKAPDAIVCLEELKLHISQQGLKITEILAKSALMEPHETVLISVQNLTSQN